MVDLTNHTLDMVKSTPTFPNLQKQTVADCYTHCNDESQIENIITRWKNLSAAASLPTSEETEKQPQQINSRNDRHNCINDPT